MSAQTVWTNTASNFSWNDPANWSGGVPTAAVLANFTNTGAGTLTLGANQSALGLAFTNTTPYVFNSGAGTNTLTVNASGITSSTAGAVTINPQLVLGASQTWAFTNAGGSLTTGAVELGANALTVGATNAAPINITGVVSGGTAATNVLNVGGGTVTLSGASSFAGNVQINGGTLALAGGNDRLPTAAAVTFNNTAGVLALGATNQTLTTLGLTTTLAGNVAAAGAVTGTGTLTLNGPVFQVGPAGATTGTPVHTLNLSGLSTFVYNNSTGVVRVGLANGATNTAALGQVATLTLATTNTITAATLAVGDTSASNDGGGSTLNLGAANAFNVTNLNFGNGVRNDVNVQFAAGLTNPTLTIRGLTGGTSSANALNLGQAGTFTGAAQTVFAQTFDTSAGTLDANITTLTIGNAAGGTGATRVGTTNATFTMGAGVLNATTLNLGLISGTSSPTGANPFAGNGTFTLTNGGVVNVTTVNLAANTLTATAGAGARSVSGIFNLTNGTLRATTIQRGANTGLADVTPTARVNWTTGTVENTAGANLALTGVPVVLAAGTHTFNATGTNSITLDAGSVVSGPSGITKAGPGTLVLGSPSTYTGTTSVTAGTVQLAAGGTLGATTAPLSVSGGLVNLNGVNTTVGALSGTGGTIANNATGAATLTAGGATGTTSTYAGTLANNTGTGGTLALTKTGGSTLILAGTNTYTGDTTVAGGTLAVTSAYPVASALTVNTGGAFSLVNGTAAPVTGVAGLTLGAGAAGVASLALELAAPGTADALGTAGTATTANTVRFDITGLTGFGAGSYTLLTAGGGLTGATYQIGQFPFGYGFTLNPTATSVQLAVFAVTPTTGPIYWTGASGTSWAPANGGNSPNFAADPAGTSPIVGTPNPTNTVTFSSTAGAAAGVPTTTSTLDGNYTVNDLVFNNQTANGAVTAVVIAPGNSPLNTLTLTPASATAGIRVAAGAPPSVTVSAPVALGAAQTWTVTDPAAVLTVGGGVSGTANLTKAGAGTLRLGDGNLGNYSGAITVAAGTLAFDFTAAAQTVPNAIGGAGAVVKAGTNALTLSGPNSYAGGTTLGSGTLNINSPTAIGSGTLSIAAGATLGNSSGATQVLTANNNQVWNGDFTKSGNSLDFGTGGVTLTATSAVTVTNTLTIGGVVSGAGFGVTKAGAGTLTLTNPANTYTGPTTVSAGILSVATLANGGQPSGVGASGPAAANLVLNGGQLNVNASSATDRGLTVGGATRIVLPTAASTLALNGALTGTGTLNVGTSNSTVGQDTTVTLTADNSAFTGGVTLNNGTLVVTNSNALGTGTKTITVQVNTTGFAALQLNPQGGPAIVLPATFSYVTSATAVNAGIVNVAGSNTVNGNVTLAGGNGATNFQSNAGTLTFANGVITANTTGRFLQLRGDGAGVVSSVIQDTGTNTVGVQRLEGTGTWTLTGNNTYTVATTVTSGVLLVNGQTGTNSGTGTAAVNVNGGAATGGTFGGTGRAAGLVTVAGGAVPGTLRPGDAAGVGTLTLGGGLTTAAGGRLSFRITDASTSAAANSGGSTLGSLPNPTSNSFLNLAGGTTTLSAGTVIVLDGTGVAFTPGASYSYLIGQGAGDQSALAITNSTQFLLTNIPANPSSLSFTGTAAGNLYVNFVPVPEPASVLGVAAAGLAGLAAVRRRRGA